MAEFEVKKDKVLVMGGLIVDKYIVVDKYPLRGEDALINNAFNLVGGCTINVAATLKNLGIDAYPVSYIGEDEDGKMIEKYLQDSKINNHCVAAAKGKNTGYCLVILDSASERTFMTYKGCEEIFSHSLINQKFMEETAFVYLTGYYLLGEYADEILSYIKEIKQAGASVMFDPGPLVDEISDEILGSVLGLCDVFVPNISELTKIKTRLNIKEEFNEWAARHKINYLIIKNGSRGVTAFQGEKKYKRPAYNINAIDTTGAGDSFAAGCIYGFIRKMDFQEIIDTGCAAGALNTTFIGPNGSYNIEDVERLMRGENTNVK